MPRQKIDSISRANNRGPRRAATTSKREGRGSRGRGVLSKREIADPAAASSLPLQAAEPRTCMRAAVVKNVLKHTHARTHSAFCVVSNLESKCSSTALRSAPALLFPAARCNSKPKRAKPSETICAAIGATLIHNLSLLHSLLGEEKLPT